jgi:hypothetical protein
VKWFSVFGRRGKKPPKALQVAEEPSEVRFVECIEPLSIPGYYPEIGDRYYAEHPLVRTFPDHFLDAVEVTIEVEREP